MPRRKSFVIPACLLLLFLLTLSPLCGASGGGGIPRQELWCVAKNNAEDAALLTALDWACGAGGADCGPIQQGGACYDTSSVQNTASYAFNDYFLKHGMADDSCNFNNNAAVTSLNPSQWTPLSLSLYFNVFFFSICFMVKKISIFSAFWFSGFGNCKFPSGWVCVWIEVYEINFRWI